MASHLATVEKSSFYDQIGRTVSEWFFSLLVTDVLGFLVAAFGLALDLLMYQVTGNEFFISAAIWTVPTSIIFLLLARVAFWLFDAVYWGWESSGTKESFLTDKWELPAPTPSGRISEKPSNPE